MVTKKNISEILKLSVIISFPVILSLFFILSFLSSTQDEKEIALLKGDMTSRMSILQDLVAHDFTSITSDLQILAESELLQDYLRKGNNKNYNNLKKFFLSFSNRKKFYDQIRFIDFNGEEKIRINFNSGKPKAVKAEELQNKRNRYYFENVFKLEKDEIFVSPMDLNIENGKVEIPQKPMIRFGTPVFDEKNNKIGIVLLNYFGDYILNNIKKHYSGFDGKGMLLNSDGYWLLAPNTEDTWGFMYKSKKDKIFSNKYHNEWDSLLSKNTGQFLSPRGFFTFETVYPINEVWKSSKGSEAPFSSHDYLIKSKKYFWKLLLFYPMDKLNERFSHRSNTNVIFFIFSIIIFFLSLLLSRAIIKRKLAEESRENTLKTLRISEQKLLKENAAKDKFFSIISHDLKSPFQGIMGFGNMLATNHTELTKEELNDSLQTLNNSIINVYDLLEGLLEWSRIQTNRLELTPENLYICDSVKKITELLSLNASKKEIMLKCDIDNSINIFIDKRLFETVLRNLIANAIKFTNKKGVVTIYSNVNNNKIEIIVEDSGIGISQSDLKKLFKLDIHHTTKGTNSEQGTGLGLILCKDLLKKANGEIDVTSQLGVGSKFIISFSLTD
jgi:signal transduction histidine kinase